MALEKFIETFVDSSGRNQRRYSIRSLGKGNGFMILDRRRNVGVEMSFKTRWDARLFLINAEATSGDYLVNGRSSSGLHLVTGKSSAWKSNGRKKCIR
jgi:hypothetical protein